MKAIHTARLLEPPAGTALPGMKILMIFGILVSACAHIPGGGAAPTIDLVELRRTFEMGLDVAEHYRIPAIQSRRFTYEELWAALETPVGAPVFQVEEVGRSLQGRPIRTVTFGHGPTTALLWSQMHGDESTATMALADIINYFSDSSPDPFREDLLDRLTVVLIPMLNPDGAQLFQRRNAVGIDINRDARRLATPEARVLKKVRDRVQPQFGFNLHDQGPHTYAGEGGPRAAIALLAPAADVEKSWGPVRARARMLAATIAEALQTELPGRIARYGDAFNPRAFGDLMQQWGTSTVLIESGVLDDDPEKQRLRAVNVAALLTALDAIASSTYQGADISAYESLPPNRGFTYDLLIRGGMLVFGDAEPMRVDLAFAYSDAVADTGLVLREVGDLEGVGALEIVDATSLFLHPEPPMVTSDSSGAWLLIGAPAFLTLRRGPDRGSELVRVIRKLHRKELPE